MPHRRILTMASLLAILLLMLIAALPVGNRVRAAPFVAIIVYDHGFAKGLVYGRHTYPANITDSFTQDDGAVYAYFTAAVSSANITWLWYQPTGQLYTNSTQQISCDFIPCTFTYYFPVRYTPAGTYFGVWTLTLQAGGNDLYTDHFTISPVINQDDAWRFDVTQSNPPLIHGYLTVTLHPHNGTWSSYAIIMPYAANITAYDYSTNRTLEVVTYGSNNQTIVNLGAPQSDGYTFVISFDLKYGVSSTGGWNSGYFAFRWEVWTGTLNDYFHPVPTSYQVTLPQGASLLDTVGINDLALNQNVTTEQKTTVSFLSWLPPEQGAGWTILYRDAKYANTNLQPQPSSNPAEGLSAAQAQPIPFLPMTVGTFSVWSAVMSVLLLTGSELLSPVYARTGVVIDRRRLRIAAVVLVVLFLAASTYQVIAIAQPTGH